ncbi:MAG TPA: hypothetical protein VJ895_00240 [Candidatus Nanoarchaeia archaeon]|nr:hypothetical protein [Candidatus Nanoarchaeia archaeon]
MRSETHEGFLDKLTYDIGSNSYVRILKEVIDEKGKKSFSGYNLYTDIDMVVDSQTQNMRYKLNIAFDRTY